MRRFRKPTVRDAGEKRSKRAAAFLPYGVIVAALLEGKEVSFDEIKRQTAHQAAKKLTEMVGKHVVARRTGKHGYAFVVTEGDGRSYLMPKVV